MTQTSRRRFLAAGLGTAAGAAAMTVGSGSSAAAADEVLPAGARGPMAAYVRDVRKGEVALMIEGREVVVKDKRLVARLASAYARAAKS
jgi:hypothetical protein